jgi:hypothetical protein
MPGKADLIGTSSRGRLDGALPGASMTKSLSEVPYSGQPPGCSPPSGLPTSIPRSVFVVCVHEGSWGATCLVAAVDNEHGTGRVRCDGLRDASDQYTGKSGATMGTKHDDACVVLAGDLDDA